MRVSEIKKIDYAEKKSHKISIAKITAAWAFSEAALGGLLHALHIPFTGLMVGGAASIFISLIAYYSEKPEEVMRSTIIVVIIKGIIAPHTPLTAYFSVMGQGAAGYLIFKIIANHKIASLLTSTITVTFFGFQKLIFLTVLFGNEFWNSINIFSNYIIDQFVSGGYESKINISLMIILGYGVVHFIGGVIFGIIAGRMPKNILSLEKSINTTEIMNMEFEGTSVLPTKRKKKKVLKYSFGIVLIAMMAGSYFIPDVENQTITKILIMFLRSVVILFLLFTFIGPYLRKLLNKYTAKKKNEYADEIEKIIDVFPLYKKYAAYSWKKSNDYQGVLKIKIFFKLLFALLLLENKSNG
ncbi:MAG: hypothetical protein HND52_00640 [Ignavibacteriae bacterium]|nr:hypothetical protein [Ignavibacteriota bacterium]NOG96454.1 hypothetical protein [Ignavibacteriota bacterium]